MKQLALVVWLVGACGGGGGPAVDGAIGAPDGDPSLPDGDVAMPDAGGGAPDGSVPGLTDLQRLRDLAFALPLAPSDTARRNLVEDFNRTVAYGPAGFPIVEDGQLGVALFAAGDGDFTVAGDFNGWNGAEHHLVQPVAGFPFYYAIVDAPSPSGLYKLVYNGATWFADPLARSIGWDENGQYSLAAPAGRARLERWFQFDASAGALEPREVDVFVPAGPTPAGGYRVVYMHDGQNLFDPEAIWGGWRAWEAAEAAIEAGVEPFLIVAIPNTSDRIDEYTPVTEIVGGTEMGGRADEYVAYVVNGIKPHVDARYPTRTAPEDTAVVGSSLGGVISYHALIERPDVFGHAGSLSGAFWFGSGTLSNPTLMHAYAMTPPPSDATFYLDSGGDDGGGCLDSDGDGVSDDGGGSDGYCQTLDMLDVLTAEGFDPIYAWAPGALHNEAAWAARLPDVFIDWFPGTP